MSWLLFCLITQVIVRSLACLSCSKEAMGILREFKNDFLEKKLHRDPELKKKLQKNLDNFVEKLPHQEINTEKYMAVLDEFSVEKLAAHFKRAIDRIVENDFEDGQLFNEVMWSLQSTTTAFKELTPAVAKFHCSNRCGRMLYVLINCFSCLSNIYSCYKTYWCGERKIQVEMDEDIILDCGMQWHKFSLGGKSYKFFRMVKGKPELLVSSTDPFLVKKEANVNDMGRYRCNTVDPDGRISSELNFQVNVVPVVSKTTWFPRPSHTSTETPLTLGAMSSREPPPEADWTAWIVIGGTGGLLAFIVIIFLCYCFRKRKKGKERDEEDNSESDSSGLVEM